MAINERQSANYKHVSWLDLENSGVLTESAVIKRDGYGNIYFIRLGRLDNIDKKRIFDIITNRNAANFELWDLMSQVTLGNGINSLVYFHQLVEVVTPSGVVSKPQQGRLGVNLNRPAGTAVPISSEQATAEGADVVVADQPAE